MDEQNSTEDLPQKQGDSREYKVGDKKPPLETRFKPGQSGNPGGRKSNDLNLTKLIREVLESRTIGGEPIPKGRKVADIFADIFIREALKGKFAFAKEVLERIDGKVMQQISLSNADDDDYRFDISVDENDSPQ